MSSDTGNDVSGLSYETRDRLYQVALYGSGLVFAFVGLFPIYWMAQNAFKSRGAILEGVSLLPTASSFTLDNFAVLTNSEVLGYLLNTIIITFGTIIMVVAISTVAGYGLARFQFPHKNNFARFLLFGYMFSPIVLGLPLYLIWRQLGLLNTHLGMIIALSAVSMPFSVWLMWKYIQTIPTSMEERVWISGGSRWRSFRDVIVPQSLSAMIATSLFAFAIAWNDFTFAQILLPSQEATTFAPGILRLVYQSYEVSWGDLMAVSLVMTVPPMLFAYFLQGYLLKGFEIRSL